MNRLVCRREEIGFRLGVVDRVISMKCYQNCESCTDCNEGTVLLKDRGGVYEISGMYEKLDYRILDILYIEVY